MFLCHSVSVVHKCATVLNYTCSFFSQSIQCLCIEKRQIGAHMFEFWYTHVVYKINLITVMQMLHTSSQS